MKIRFLVLVLMIFNAHADCMHEGKAVPTGQTIAFLDPVLVNEAIEYYMKKEVSYENALKMAEKSDWTWVVLGCFPSYVPITDSEAVEAGEAGAMISRVDDVWVPVMHQIEFVADLKGISLGKRY